MEMNFVERKLKLYGGVPSVEKIIETLNSSPWQDFEYGLLIIEVTICYILEIIDLQLSHILLVVSLMIISISII